MSSRVKAVLALAVLLTVLAGGYGGFWLLAANTAEDALLRWAEARRAEGYQVYWGDMGTTGFPAAMRLTVTDPQVRFPEAEGGGGWAAPVVHVTAHPWSPRTLKITAPGEHRANFVADRRVYQTRAQAGEAALTLEVTRQGEPEAGDIHLRALEVHGLAPAGPLRLASLDAAVVHNPGGGASLFERTEARDTGIHGAIDIDLRDLSLPPGLTLPIGDSIDEARLQAVMVGDLPPGSDLKGRLRRWQDAGGTVEIDRLTLAAAPLRLGAVGTATLDDWLQPQVALTAQIRGFFEMLDRLESQGVLRPRDVSIAKVVLGVMATQPPDGGPAALELPVTVQERMLYLGPVALTELPPLRWGGTAPPGPGEIKPGFEIDSEGRVVREE